MPNAAGGSERRNDRIRVFTNWKDWLQTDEDRRWEQDVFGDRIEIWPEGGHLGNAATPEARQKAIEVFSSMLGSTPTE